MNTITVPVMSREWDRIIRAGQFASDEEMEDERNAPDVLTYDEVLHRIASAIVGTRPETDPDDAYSTGLLLVDEFAGLDADERAAIQDDGCLTIGFGPA